METLVGLENFAFLGDFKCDLNFHEDVVKLQNMEPSLASSKSTSVASPTKWKINGPSYLASVSPSSSVSGLGRVLLDFGETFICSFPYV